MPTSGVRLARTSDVDDLAAVHVRSWRHRLGGIVPDAILDDLDAGDIAMAWASGILNPPTRQHLLLVAVDDDALVGYAAIGPGQDADADDTTVELMALEIDPDRMRMGHGSRLMAAAIDHARGTGTRAAMTWCPLDDEVRRAFLQSAGWGPDTAYRDIAVGTADDGSEIVVREVRLATSLE